MSLLNKIFNSKKSDPEPVLTQERVIPKKDILSVQTFTHSRGFKGFRRVKLSTYGLDGVELNHRYLYKKNKFDFDNSAIQLMTVKATNETGTCIRVVIEGRFVGNIYKNERNAEIFDNIVDKNIDKVHAHVEYAEDDKGLLAYDTYIMVHWPNMGPKITIK